MKPCLPALALTAALASPAFAQADLYATDFSSDEGWSFSVAHSTAMFGAPWWAVDGLPADPDIYRSAPSSLNFNHDEHGLILGSWDGTARSPVVDLGEALGDLQLSFWYKLYGEGGCNVWVVSEVRVVDASTGAVRHASCFSDLGSWGEWFEVTAPLDRSWGRVRIELRYVSSDAWNAGQLGLLIDDLHVTDLSGASVECEGQSLTDGSPGATLELAGSASIGSGALTLTGAGFPAHSFASAFVGTGPATLPIGAGVRCISPVGSQRLWIAPTRATGTPRWTLELGAAPLSQIATAGLPLYVQAIFRDGPTVNFSSTLVFTPIP
ncbi:MAG: hypothetical protein AAGB93_05000 [Planctomycetota bacterium]